MNNLTKEKTKMTIAHQTTTERRREKIPIHIKEIGT